MVSQCENEGNLFRAVIFDLDGTLLYTLENLCESTNYALRRFGCPMRTLEEIRSFVGNGVKKLIERAMPDGSENPDFKKCLALFKEHYSKTMHEKTRPYNGITELLEKLKKSGVKRAVNSNKYDSAVKELCDKYFGVLIDSAVGESETTRKKPAPDGVFKVLNELDTTKEPGVKRAVNIIDCTKVIYVGDSEVDIETARNAGIECISVTWGYKDEDFLIAHGAKRLAHTPDELLEMLEDFFG